MTVFNEIVIRRYESLKPKCKRIIKETSAGDHDKKDDPGGQSTALTEKEDYKRLTTA